MLSFPIGLARIQHGAGGIEQQFVPSIFVFLRKRGAKLASSETQGMSI